MLYTILNFLFWAAVALGVFALLASLIGGFTYGASEIKFYKAQQERNREDIATYLRRALEAEREVENLRKKYEAAAYQKELKQIAIKELLDKGKSYSVDKDKWNQFLRTHDV